jgi:tryptophanyl-tRNA synthetase
MSARKPRQLSGIQPSGQLHLGNYFGAIQRHIADQEESYYFIANYHALTTLQNADELRRNTTDVAVTYLACGLDPEKAVLFRQSDIPEVTELTWLLMTVTPMGLLERAVSYKDKISKGLVASAGLFTYPALMAADILAYRSDIVPVGPDQVQHVEMTRDMARAFNRTYGDVFNVPEYYLCVEAVVPGLDGTKMSKSYGNTIPLFASGEELKKLVMSIKTSSLGVEEPKDPDTCTVFQLFALVAEPSERDEMAARYRAGGYGYREAKQQLLSKLEDYFATARRRRAELLERISYVDDVLADGARRARSVAREVLDAARSACGVA